MANNNNKHIQVYKDNFGDGPHQCEVCGAPATEIHHIEYRSGFGAKLAALQDAIWNLIALCRICHTRAHGPKTDPHHLSEEYLKEIVAKR